MATHGSHSTPHARSRVIVTVRAARTRPLPIWGQSSPHPPDMGCVLAARANRPRTTLRNGRVLGTRANRPRTISRNGRVLAAQPLHQNAQVRLRRAPLLRRIPEPESQRSRFWRALRPLVGCLWIPTLSLDRCERGTRMACPVSGETRSWSR